MLGMLRAAIFDAFCPFWCCVWRRRRGGVPSDPDPPCPRPAGVVWEGGRAVRAGERRERSNTAVHPSSVARCISAVFALHLRNSAHPNSAHWFSPWFACLLGIAFGSAASEPIARKMLVLSQWSDGMLEFCLRALGSTQFRLILEIKDVRNAEGSVKSFQWFN